MKATKAAENESEALVNGKPLSAYPGITGPLPPVEKRIKALLRSTDRDNIDSVIDYLEDEGFFTSPASTKYHGAHEGGLAQHSLRVFELLAAYFNWSPDIDKAIAEGQRPFVVTASNLIIAGLLHDVCKVGAYLGNGDPYKWNKQMPRGHGELSIIRIRRIIVLEPIERMMIQFHSGIYGTFEFYDPSSWDYKTQPEYHLRSIRKKGEKKPVTKEEKEADKKSRYGKSLRNVYFHNPICFWCHVCDMQAMAEDKLAEYKE